MKKAIVFSIFSLCLWISHFSMPVLGSEINWEDIARGNLDLKAVLVNPDDPRIIYIATIGAIFKTGDGGGSWKSILSIKGQNKAVNYLLFDSRDKSSLYAATGCGLYHSNNEGKSWRRIFKGKDYLENECSALLILPDAIYLGTKAGLFISKDKGRTWQKESGKMGRSHVLAIASNFREPNYIYTASVVGVFRTSDAGESWEKVLVTFPAEIENDPEKQNDGQLDEESGSLVRYISCDPNNPNLLYLATGRGVYRSQDKGKGWVLLSGYGLLDHGTKFLLISEGSRIYTLTKSGIFEYKNERWYELSLDLIAQEINFLAQDRLHNLYAACDRGLFKAHINNLVENSQDNFKNFYYKDEPKINEVQEAAIRYAEVEPSKVRLWRKQAAMKALLPQFNIGINRDTTDLWHWESGSTTKAGDDTLMSGRDTIEWDLSLSWDLGEIVWNNDQTSIDARSRLTVQLREDILDEVTKIYFERIRTKMELDTLSIEDRKKRQEKELRLQELSAMLDALTGGYFSRCIQKSRNAT